MVDFPIIDDNNFSLEQLLNVNYIDIGCMLEIPENEFSDTLKEDIRNKFRALISNDSVYFDIEVYTEETYNGREELYKKDESLFEYGNTNILRGISNISFFVEEEDEMSLSNEQ